MQEKSLEAFFKYEKVVLRRYWLRYRMGIDCKWLLRLCVFEKAIKYRLHTNCQ